MLKRAILQIFNFIAISSGDYLFSGYYTNPQIGSLWYDKNIFTLPDSLFASFIIKRDKDKNYVIDENYDSSMGSTLYEITSSSLHISKSISNKNCLGGVFLLSINTYIYIPGFGSNNIWIVDNELTKTIALVPIQVGTNPHSIYYHNDIFYVLCRGMNEIPNSSNFINVYKSFDLSVRLSTIDLSIISNGEVVNSGPRHGVFLENNLFYIITEFTHQIVMIDVSDPQNVFYKGSTVIEYDGDCTGAEIRYFDQFIYVSLRITKDGQSLPGRLYKYSLDLLQNEYITVGKNPRFFNIIDTNAIVLNMDSNSYTEIDLNTWKILDTIYFDPPFNPQCFVK
jgi:hypothetical protein